MSDNSTLFSYKIFSGGLRHNERRLTVEKWRKICDRINLETTVVPSNDFLCPIMTPLKHWIGKFEFYCQNYLSMRMSNKWPLLEDPHGLALDALKAQNENLVIVAMGEERLPDVLRQAIAKGNEVLVMNFDPKRVRPGLRAIFYRQMTERIHAFVGLMGIPIMRRDQRVRVDGQEVICNPKFKLLLHSQCVQEKILSNIKNTYNVVMFDYSTDALELQLLKRVMIQLNKEFYDHYNDTMNNIRHLEQTVIERKDNVLDILLKTEEDVLDDKSVIVSLKEAKAKVFEILNDLNQEKKEMVCIENSLPGFRIIAHKLRGMINLLDLLAPNSNSSPLPVVAFMELIENVSATGDTSENMAEFLKELSEKVLDIALPSLLSKNRYILQMGCNILLNAKADYQMSSNFETLMKHLFDIKDDSNDWKEAAKEALDSYLDPVNENVKKEEENVKEQFHAFLNKDGHAFEKIINIEKSLIENLQKMSAKRPLLVFSDTSGALDTVDILCDLARSYGLPSPKYISASLITPSEVAFQILSSKKEKRWLIVDNFEQVTIEIVESLAPVIGGNRIFLIANHNTLGTPSLSMHNKVSFLSLTHAPYPSVRKDLFMSLLTLRLKGPSAKTYLDGILKLHEYLVQNQPELDQYRYLNIFVKKWQHKGKNLMTAEDILGLIVEVYGFEEAANDELLKSTLREVSFSMK